ncbi:Hypothetical_protein [Hexamita inflata]|uniref:Hypothetical_protein n=1 Tax=Hexamita inflata TaxID=28002 RepID=A0AA86P606_9EUKA|nr:Hypothetical protein HINF_LOCUS19148 [Hexamita inflata]
MNMRTLVHLIQISIYKTLLDISTNYLFDDFFFFVPLIIMQTELESKLAELQIKYDQALIAKDRKALTKLGNEMDEIETRIQKLNQPFNPFNNTVKKPKDMSIKDLKPY